MASITSLGTGSGLDLEGIVSKLMAIEEQPLTALATKQAAAQAKLSAFGTLKSALSTLQTAAQALATPTTFTNTTATVSDSTALSVTSTGAAASGSYTLKVGQLAQGQVFRTTTNFAATTDTFNTGSLAISVGGATAINVPITSSNNSLAGIRDAINAASTGVSASIVNDGTTNRLLLTSQTTGLTAGAISVVASDDGSGGTNALSVLDSSNLLAVQDPLDANFSVNGLAITRSSNTISDVITGVTVNLTKAGTLASPLTSQLTVTRDDKATQTAVSSFVTAYNAAVKQIKTFTTYNATTNTAAVLTGDGTLRNIQSQLSGLVSASVSGLDGGISRLSDIGVSMQKDGTMLLDSTRLQKTLTSNFSSVSSLFSSTTTGNEGVAVRFKTIMDGFVSTTGLIASRTDGLNATIKSITKQGDALSIKLDAVEKRYRAQFAALDTAVASMQSTSSYLTQQLASLAASLNN